MRGLGTLTVTLAVALLAAGLPAQAALVTPSSRPLVSTVVDAAARWEPESGCDQTEKKGPKRLRQLLIETYGLVPSNILRACSAADSGHEEGRALDWMVNARVPEQKAMGDAFASWLMAPDEFGNVAAMARRLGLSYVIWNNQMWRPSTGTATVYRTCDKPKFRFRKWDNTCHRNHVHVSFSWDGALGRTSFFTGFVSCAPPLVTPWSSGVLPAQPEVVPVEPVRVFRSRTGLGSALGPCRVHPDVRLDLPVLGVGAVPATGVASVTLRVAVTKADAPTELRAWTAGTELPLTPVATADRKLPVTVDVTVPLSAEGLASLQLAGGMAHVTVDIVGYNAAVPVAPPVEPPVASPPAV